MRILISITFLLSTLINHAQLEVAGGYGYTFGARAPILGGNARISDGSLFHFGLNYLYEDYSIEISYNYQELIGSARSSFWNFDVRDNIRINYILLGGNRHFDVSDKLILYSGLKAGILNISSIQDNFRSRTKLALGLNGGARYFITDNLGCKLQFQLFFPITDVGASLWWSPGGGTSVGVTSSSPFAQFGTFMGLFYRLPY
jgi:opacity protein-like surface antigen